MIKKTNEIVDTLKESRHQVIGYLLLLGEKEYGLLNVELLKNGGLIHCRIDDWGLAARAESQKDWEIIKKDLRSMGLKKLECRKKAPDPKFESFITKFGFEKPETFMISRRNL